MTTDTIAEDDLPAAPTGNIISTRDGTGAVRDTAVIWTMTTDGIGSETGNADGLHLGVGALLRREETEVATHLANIIKVSSQCVLFSD